ncbi:hypothetical protein [Symbiopectobacterium sp. RP]|uniref:hypothetical protein n=1 Tax=Symbiopectobacterium sp. RP TaxID=3248553 RepID=UPI003D2BD66D
MITANVLICVKKIQLIIIKIMSLGYISDGMAELLQSERVTVTDAQPAGVGKKEVAQSAVETVEERADSL